MKIKTELLNVAKVKVTTPIHQYAACPLRRDLDYLLAFVSLSVERQSYFLFGILRMNENEIIKNIHFWRPC